MTINIKKIKVIDREKRMPKTQTLKIPFSGSNKRRFRVQATLQNHQKKILTTVQWSIYPALKGVSMDGEGLLVILPEAEPGRIEVQARVSTSTGTIEDTTEIEVTQTKGRDFPANPLKKEGWKLYYHDEFNEATIDRTAWVDQYLRNWSDDIHSQTDYSFEDGAIVIKADIDSTRWSPYDPNECSSISSFEKTYLHRFGNNLNESSRQIPRYDGVATKYGYFEIRAKLPDTWDGSHVAWWMIGVQDDQNINPTVEDPTVLDQRSSNETGEVDVIEIGLNDLHSWRPVMHPNGSTSLEYLHVPETVLDFDPGNEFHIYGYEWDANGTKFYVDNKLVQVTDRTFDYRMMTILGVYAQGGMGRANKIFPKEFVIDYFRIYKKDEPERPNDIRFHEDELVHTIQKPNIGNEKKFQWTATVLDSFDRPIQRPLIWSFSECISGDNARDVTGATIDPETGEVTLTDEISERVDLFVTAKVKENQAIKKVFHVRVASEMSIPQFMQIENHCPVRQIEIATGEATKQVKFAAQVLDQYREPITGEVMWRLASGTSLREDPIEIKGVSLNTEKGILTITKELEKDQLFFVQAYAEPEERKVEGFTLDTTIYAHQCVQVRKKI